MNTRTKWLLIGAASVFGLYFADSFYRSWIEEPQQHLIAQIDALNEKVQEAKDQQLVAQKIGKQLDNYAGRALPYDPQLARSGYQKWLLDLVAKHDVRSASVDAGQPVPITIRVQRNGKSSQEVVGHRISYSLRGQDSLARLTDFLYDFRQVGHLHKIRSLTLNPVGTEGQLDINMTIEVLSLEATPRKDGLSAWRLAEDAAPPRDQYQQLVHRNLFAQGFAQVLYDVQLKAITFGRSGAADAWFQVDSQGNTERLGVGETVPVALHEIVVADIKPERVLVEVNGDPGWIKLGQSVGDILSSEKPADSSDELVGDMSIE
jgi:hypothetical protein